MLRFISMLRHFRPRSRYELILLLGSLILIAGSFIFFWTTTIPIPDIRSLEERKVTQSTKIYDRTGTILLDDLGDDVTRTIVPISEISPYIQKASVAIEDSEFYEHNGIKVTSFIRSILVNVVRLGFEQGGSTITQQVVKNSILTTDKTIIRKVKEWVLALKLEQILSKEEILSLYLNESPYGGSMYGVEEASMRFFGKPANAVTLAEAAYLAAIPQAPTYFSPYGNHLDALESRKNLVLARMHELGFISSAEYDAAIQEQVQFQPPSQSGIRAPHFVFFVREQLEKEYGQRALEENGWRIITTLDMELEEKAEEIVKRYALENQEKFNASNAAIVAIHPQTGDILTMAGSRDYFDDTIDGNVNIAVAKRQPGSSFKPFVYAAAFQKGYAPETALFDVRTQFSTLCPADSTSEDPPCYYPENYDGVYRGPMSLRDALAQSINTVAVKVLYLVGLEPALQVARTMGITTLEGPDRYGLTLVLGGGEVTLLDLVSAYGVFANEGTRNPYRAILSIQDRDGAVVREYPLQPVEALDQSVAHSISDVLADNAARTPAFGSNSALSIPGQHVAAKTGTTNDYRDAWIVGYSPTIAVGAWAGNNDNTPMEKRVAGFIVAPLWNEFMRAALQKYPSSPFPEPEPLVTADSKPILRGIWQGSDSISDPSGMLRVTTAVHSILYWVDKNNPAGPKLSDPNQDPQFSRWEYAVRRWAVQHGYHDGTSILIHPR